MKPLWIEQILDDKDLHEFLIRLMTMVERLPKELEHVIDLEKRDIRAKRSKLVRRVISLRDKELSVCMRLLQRFEQNRFLPSNVIEEHSQKLHQIENRTEEILARA